MQRLEYPHPWHLQGRSHLLPAFLHITVSITVVLHFSTPHATQVMSFLISCSMRVCRPQLRRTRAWFPCVDQPLAACPFELHFTVPASQMAISCGQLIKQKWTEGAKRRTFHYKLSIATPPQDIALVVGEHVCVCASSAGKVHGHLSVSLAALDQKHNTVERGNANTSSSADGLLATALMYTL